MKNYSSIEKFSIEELENDYWGEAPSSSSNIVKKSFSLRKKKIKEFEIDDFRFMLNQNIGVEFIAPVVIKILLNNPFEEGNYFKGDLLKAFLDSDFIKKKKDKTIYADIDKIIKEVKSNIDQIEISPEIKLELQKVVDLAG
jgi:hypothetical protein